MFVKLILAFYKHWTGETGPQHGVIKLKVMEAATYMSSCGTQRTKTKRKKRMTDRSLGSKWTERKTREEKQAKSRNNST